MEFERRQENDARSPGSLLFLFADQTALQKLHQRFVHRLMLRKLSNCVCCLDFITCKVAHGQNIMKALTFRGMEQYGLLLHLQKGTHFIRNRGDS